MRSPLCPGCMKLKSPEVNPASFHCFGSEHSELKVSSSRQSFQNLTNTLGFQTDDLKSQLISKLDLKKDSNSVSASSFAKHDAVLCTTIHEDPKLQLKQLEKFWFRLPTTIRYSFLTLIQEYATSTQIKQ